MSADLAEQAARRARLAALLGRLLVAEPGPDVGDLVAGVPALAALDDPSLAADYERLLLREVPTYESVFLGADGQLGGAVTAEVVAAYERYGFDETARVAGPDHLGLELRCYARLCAEEEAGWRADQPDRAARAVEDARAFLAAHLGRWGTVAATALARRASLSPYGSLAVAVADFLGGEAELLRPDPDHPDLPPVAPPDPPGPMGPARLARHLLAPGRSGAFLDTDDLGDAALSLGIPWRPSDPRSRFRQVVEDAVDGGDLPALLARLRPAVQWWAEHHARQEDVSPGQRRTWRWWRLRAEATLELLDERSAPGRVAGPAVVEVGAAADPGAAVRTAERVLTALREAGLRVAVAAPVRDRLTSFLGSLLAAGAGEVLLTGPGLSLLAQPDAGPDPDRWARLLPDAEVVVRLTDGPAATRAVTLAEGADAAVADRCRRALHDLLA